MYNLATLLALGEGVPEDRVEALAWYRRAAALGHAKSINLIGGFYEEGWVVDRDLAIAREHYRVAAEGGDFRAQYNYARFLIAEGWIDVALFWLRRVPETATPDFLGNLAAFLIDSPHHTLQAFGHELVTRGHAAVRADAAEPVTAAADADPARGATLFPDAGGRSPLARLRRLFARPSPASVADARIFERTAT
jgi:TPR repeat protein